MDHGGYRCSLSASLECVLVGLLPCCSVRSWVTRSATSSCAVRSLECCLPLGSVGVNVIVSPVSHSNCGCPPALSGSSCSPFLRPGQMFLGIRSSLFCRVLRIRIFSGAARHSHIASQSRFAPKILFLPLFTLFSRFTFFPFFLFFCPFLFFLLFYPFIPYLFIFPCSPFLLLLPFFPFYVFAFFFFDLCCTLLRFALKEISKKCVYSSTFTWLYILFKPFFELVFFFDFNVVPICFAFFLLLSLFLFRPCVVHESSPSPLPPSPPSTELLSKCVATITAACSPFCFSTQEKVNRDCGSTGHCHCCALWTAHQRQLMNRGRHM